jgi:A nuclease family of the HNH/ENDO VII superfamily with conserved AHH
VFSSIRDPFGAPFDHRQFLSFRAVNRFDAPGYDPGLQRHHLLPRQILGRNCFQPMLDAVGRERLRFDDFRRNGLLLPANDRAAVRIGLPLHRGPHRDYNALVIERVGQIEAGWSSTRLRAPELALVDTLQRLELLQRALRRRLLAQQRRLRLNRSDPLGADVDFSELDAMADLLWPATETPAA